MQSAQGLPLLLAVPDGGRSWAELPGLRGDMGQPQGAWPGQAQLWAAPSPACAPGAALAPLRASTRGSGRVLPWEEDATGDRKGFAAATEGSVEMLGGASVALPCALSRASCPAGGAGSPGWALGSRGCASAAPRCSLLSL